jgi:SAM-dependent methyltransferase
MAIAGFASLQREENRLVSLALAGADAQWVLELVPASGPSPALNMDRVRMLFDAEGLVWPLRAELDAWPLDSESVPAVLLRHAWQPGMKHDLLPEALRVLKPGGLLVSVSANPWHHLAWRELGRGTLRLPSWPHLQMLHARHALGLSVPVISQWRGMIPGLTPVLILVARKPDRPARVQPLRFGRPQMATGPVPATQCRAA